MSGVEVLVRDSGGVKTLMVYRQDGRVPTAQQCEDAGEDAGFFDPKASEAHSSGPYQNARLVTEGYTGQLCKHRWDSVMHFSRNPFGVIRTCGLCRVSGMESYRKRASTGEFTYDEWTLREHIWRRWMTCGPIPGALQPQAHHKEKP